MREGAPASLDVAVVVPCYRVTEQVLAVLEGIGPEVQRVYVVDDACPDGSGDLVESRCADPRVKVLRHAERRGVGGATLSGYRQALADGAEVVVKLDGDGQMDPVLIPRFVAPIAAGDADYVKGNRFYRPDQLEGMPRARLFGNAVLSFLAKFSTGYWDIFDPNNGFTAIHAKVARELPLEKISEGWFFESDLLFRLGTIRAVVTDIPMKAVYGSEQSQLRIRRVVGLFLGRHALNFAKRIFYTYYLRSFSLASIELALGSLLLGFGVTIGAYHWITGPIRRVIATSGTVMLAALPVIIGVQLLLAFLNHDMQSQPRTPLQGRL